MTGKQLDQIVDQNPLTDVMTDPSRLMVMFFTDADDRQQIAQARRRLLGAGAARGWPAGRVLLVPDGIAASPLMEAVGEQNFDGTVTTRNWRTVTKLSQLLH